jgi:RNA recognition motif-containing protein
VEDTPSIWQHFPFSLADIVTHLFFPPKKGTVVSVEQPKEPGTGRSKGNAYARFTTPEEAYKAVELGGAQGKTIGGRWLKIQMAESDPKKANSGISDKQR